MVLYAGYFFPCMVLMLAHFYEIIAGKYKFEANCIGLKNLKDF